MVSRVVERPRADVWPFSVRDPLPTVRGSRSTGMMTPTLSAGHCEPVHEPASTTTAGYDRETGLHAQPPEPSACANRTPTWARELLARPPALKPS